MIEIKVTTREIAREQLNSDTDEVHNSSAAEIMIGGNPEEIKNELISLLEAFEKHPTFSLIWHEALCEHIFDLENKDNHL